MEFSPFEPNIFDNPYTTLKRISEKDSVYWNSSLNTWMILKHKDLMQIAKHPSVSVSAKTSEKVPVWIRTLFAPLLKGISHTLLFLDPPDHTRLRALASRAVLPKLVNSLEPRIRELTAERLEPLKARGRMDVIADFAFPLPVILISELMGVDFRDQDKFQVWTHDIARILTEPNLTLWKMYRANASVMQMKRYFLNLFGEKRKAPTEDLISYLVNESDADGIVISTDEIFSMCLLLLIAGHETTKNLIGNFVLTLLEHPEELKRLRDKPELIAPAIEEVLRFESPVQFVMRRAKADIELGGKHIKAGDSLLLSIGSANRDPDVFANPDRFDITRNPNPHVSFGHGIHFCIGAALARLEAKIMLEGLIERFPNVRLENVTRGRALAHRGIEHLWVSF